MLKKENRISRIEIDYIFKNGSLINSKNIFLKFLINKKQKNKKIAFTVPKNISKKANKRNLLRRMGYLVIKNIFDYIPQGFSGVFVFKEKALISFGEKKTKNKNPQHLLLKEIENILKQV